MDLSIVIPLFNERDNLTPLHAELECVLCSTGYSYEILFIDDGSIDGSASALHEIKARDAKVRVIRLARNSGQTAALACGLQHAQGDVIVALDENRVPSSDRLPEMVAPSLSRRPLHACRSG